MKWLDVAIGTDRIQKHQGAAREFETLGQQNRIRFCRRWLRRLVAKVWCYDSLPKICDIGCGCMEISGPLSLDGYQVFGYDCNELALDQAQERFPNVKTYLCDVDSVVLREESVGGVLVACEIMEHILHPKEFMKRNLPLFRAALIGHPLDETVDCTVSGGEHCWSFNDDDAKAWFLDNGYLLVDSEDVTHTVIPSHPTDFLYKEFMGMGVRIAH